MNSFWYLIKVIPGKERSLNQQFNQQISLGKIDKVIRFVCPTEKEFVTVRKKKVLREKVIYSGYLYFETQSKLTEDELKDISTTQNVMGILGDRTPVLMNDSDVKRIIKDDILDELTEKKKSLYNVDDKVVIIDGPFTSFKGSVSKVDGDKVDVQVIIFGRYNNITLTLDQIKKE